MRPKTCWMLLPLLLCLPAGLLSGEVTVRVGQQETCKITGAMTVEWSAQSATGQVRFDLSKLPKGAKVVRAALRLWVTPADRSPWGISRWNDPAFDGFKVFLAAGEGTGPTTIPSSEKPLAVSYPFALTYFACQEWDVTSAVAAWLADPSANHGLWTNFRLPASDSEPAWQRPYLEVTCEGENPGRPKQPTAIAALYRSGQVFLTWKQVPYDGAFFDSTYRIYMHTQPITAANLPQATPLGEVHSNSQLNYRRSAYSRDGMGSYAGYQHLRSYQGVERKPDMTAREYDQALLAKIPPRYKFVIDDAWPARTKDGLWLKDDTLLGEGFVMLEGPQLPDDTGLFVHTVTQPGKFHFAVTSVIEGNENRQDFLAGNSLAEAVEVKVDRPRPVLQVVFSRIDKGYPHQRSQMREYAYWGGPADGLHVEPSTPFYFRVNPPNEYVGLGKGGALPAWTTLGPWWSHGGDTVTVDSVYLPPTRLAPIPAMEVPFSSGGWREGWQFYRVSRQGSSRPAVAVLRSAHGIGNFYGYHDRLNTGLDPRQGTVKAFLENRALRELEAFFQEFPQASRDRVTPVAEGQSLLLGIHHPQTFACVTAAQEELWSSPRQEGQWLFVGKRSWKLPNEQGVNVWDWNDPVWYSRRFPTQAWPFISVCQSPNYARADQTHWKECGYPQFYLDMAADRRGGEWWWCDIGDAPSGHRMNIPRDQAYPAFTNVNFAEQPQQEWRKEPRGTLNGYLVWHRPEAPFAVKDKTALPPDLVDSPERLELAIRIGDGGLMLNGQSVPPTTARYGTTDITLWRTQQFKTQKRGKYLWTNRKVATGQLLQSGPAEGDDRGLVTVSGFLVDRDPAGNKLILERADGREPPAVDQSAKVGELTYAQYLQQCREPVLMPSVQPPSTTLKISEFTAVGRGEPDGSVSLRGGDFGTHWETNLRILQAGQYVIAARAKAVRGASWPLLGLQTGAFGTSLGIRAVDTTDWSTYRWYAPLEQGKLTIRLVFPNEYYMVGELPALKDKRLSIADLTLTRVPDESAGKTPVEIRLWPRGVRTPVGLPVRFQAVVLNALGQPLRTKVQWDCPQGKIDAAGVLSPEKAGDYLVTASAGGLSASATITAADKFTEDFNEGNGYLRPGWAARDLAERPGKWAPPAGGHRLLNSLRQTAEPVQSLLLWEPGAGWSDCTIAAEVILPAERGPFAFGQGKKAVWGLVLRAADKDNHYRLEVQRGDQASVVRIVKRLAGRETVLAGTDSPPPVAPFNWQSNPLCPGWHATLPKLAEDRGLVNWRMDRLRFQAAGGVLRAWINDQEVFPGGVKEADLKAGSCGLYCQGPTTFDNVEVAPARP